MLCVICYMLCVACSIEIMLYVICYMLYVTLYLLYVVYHILDVSHSIFVYQIYVCFRLYTVSRRSQDEAALNELQKVTDLRLAAASGRALVWPSGLGK